jgi:outer membrane protein assembly factor BamD
MTSKPPDFSGGFLFNKLGTSILSFFPYFFLLLQPYMKYSTAFLLFFLSLSTWILTGCNTKYNKVMKSKDVEYKLRMADQYYDQKRYRIAQTLYEELYPVYKGTDKFEELYYKDAYCFYYMKNYRDAENFFKGFLEVFPNSTKGEEVDFMRAYCFYKQIPKIDLDQTNAIKTMGMMQTFINTHPGSTRNAEATAIIDECRMRLEEKELRGADQYFKVGQFRAAAISYTNLLNNFPESNQGDKYMLKAVLAYFKFAGMSVPEKQIERYEQVIKTVEEFEDRYPESNLLKEAKFYANNSSENIKKIKDEQAKTTTQL